MKFKVTELFWVCSALFCMWGLGFSPVLRAMDVPDVPKAYADEGKDESGKGKGTEKHGKATNTIGKWPNWRWKGLASSVR